ncbi:MAG: 3'(2'),5'-bisphosphate nucleotidase CysQ [Candidatus Hydrogenedentes bacterium]|nr:3'(2'),5'-bisphosphate nucleotidase CysQ [Candidatus Hydrogenedentota bacterium]
MNQWLVETVQEAGRIALEYLERGFTVERKPDGSPVSSADLAVDVFLRDRFHMEFPDDCLLTEESPDDPGRLQRRRVWIMDPIDGTANFISGRPDFGILVALCVDGKAIESVAHFPLLSLTLYARRGDGTYVNGRPVEVSRECTGEPKVVAAKGRFEPLHTAPQLFRNNAMALFQVATGEIEGSVIECSPSAGEHDYAWASCAVEAAGGQLTDADGNPLRYNKLERKMPRVLVGSNGAVHAALLERVQAVEG